MLRTNEIKELRKSGDTEKLRQAYNMAYEDLQQNPNNGYAKRNIGWVYFEYLKINSDKERPNIPNFLHILQKVYQLMLPEEEILLCDQILWRVNFVLNYLGKQQYVKYEEAFAIIDIVQTLHFTKPSEPYSFLLSTVHKLISKNKVRYTNFLSWWGLENLRPEDFQKTKTQYGEIMSLAEKVYTAYYKALIPSQEIRLSKEQVLANIEAINNITNTHPDYIYLPYFKVQMLLAIGENKENIKQDFIPFAQKKPNEFWIWDLMQQLVTSEEDKLTCLCKACLSGHKVEKMKTGVYLEMANYFIAKQMFSEAKHEILKIKSIKEENQHKIPNEIIQLMNTSWFATTQEKNNNIKFYKEYSKNADDILYINNPAENIFIYNINTEKNIANFITKDDSIGFFRTDKLKNKIKIRNGEVYKVRFSERNSNKPSKVQTIEISEDITLKQNNLMHCTDSIKINPKGFGFINDVYIPANKVNSNQLRNGQVVEIDAIRKYNPKKETFEWSVTKLIPK